MFRNHVVVGVHGLVPGDGLSCVGGHSCHDGHHAGVGAADGVVDGGVGAD